MQLENIQFMHDFITNSYHTNVSCGFVLLHKINNFTLVLSIAVRKFHNNNSHMSAYMQMGYSQIHSAKSLRALTKTCPSFMHSLIICRLHLLVELLHTGSLYVGIFSNL